MPVFSSVDQIERALALGILRGRYSAGSRLPSIRELAVSFGVNPATIQRVVASLETRGLIEARQGSGLVVCDADAFGDLSILPYRLEALLDVPAQAVSVLEDFLEVRRIVAVRLLVRHRAEIMKRAPAIEAAAKRVFEATTLGVDAMREADTAFARTLLAATGNVVASSVFNTLAHVLRDVPTIAIAMYGEPAANITSIIAVVAALVDDDPNAADVIERSIAEVDARTVARFDAALRARGVQA